MNASDSFLSETFLWLFLFPLYASLRALIFVMSADSLRIYEYNKLCISLHCMSLSEIDRLVIHRQLHVKLITRQADLNGNISTCTMQTLN